MREPTKSFSVLLIEQHYQRNRLDQPWDSNQVNRLCDALQITTAELAALFVIPQPVMTQWLKRDKFPTYVSLHFAQIQAWFLDLALGSKSKPIVPVDVLVQHGEAA